MMYQTLMSWEVAHGIFYAFICACLVAPPEEFVQAGITIQNVLHSYLGDATIDFTGYHIRRTSATLIFHSLLPTGYAVMILYKDSTTYIWGFSSLSVAKQCCIVFCFSLPLCSALLVLYWSYEKWNNHPIAAKLKKIAPSQSSWRSVASSINIEVRRPDNFTSGHYSRQVYVTENWIVQLGTYSFDVVHQSNAVLNLCSSTKLHMAYDSPHGMQLLVIDVLPVDKSTKPFTIKLNALNYNELKDRVSSQVVNVRNVTIRQSVSERFLDEFTKHVNSNRRYSYAAENSQESEQCIGCMQTPAEIKLVKLCAAPEEGDCKNCYCRPLWCINCVGKWFCSRQDQADPGKWMSGKAPCPMCRSVFCLADICHLEPS